MGRDKDRRRGARAVLTGHYLWEESHVEIARPCLRGRGLCQAASRSSNTDHPHLLIDPRLHCSSSQPLGTLGNWSSTYGAPVPHKALSCNHVHISLLRSKETPSCHYSIPSPSYAMYGRQAEASMNPARRWASRNSAQIPLAHLNSAGFSRLHSLLKRFHSHSCSGGIWSDGPLALHPSR